MWNKGSLNIETDDGTKTCRYEVKHYPEPSEDYGIDGGRISKLEIRVDGNATLRYDRGWDIEPEDEASQLAFAAIMAKFN